MSLVLDDYQENYYNTTVGNLIWSVNLGWIDINLEISLLSHCISQSRHGHLEQVFHTLSSLEAHAKIKLVFDPFKNDFDSNARRMIGRTSMARYMNIFHRMRQRKNET